MAIVEQSPEFKTFTDSIYCFQCGTKLEALLDRYTYRYGQFHGNNIKGLEWHNKNPMIGNGLTTRCPNCDDITYRVLIDEHQSPLIRSAKAQKKIVGDIMYYVKQHELYEKLEEYGGHPEGVPIGAIVEETKKPTPVTPTKHYYYTGSLGNIKYTPKPYARVYCPVCNEAAKLEKRNNDNDSSEASIFCKYCQLHFTAQTVSGKPFENITVC